MVRYDPYTDSFIDDLVKRTTATINLDAFPMNTVQMVEISDESIEKIADAVVRKLADRKTEPQTDLANDSQVLVKDLVDDEFNPYDEECMRCKHLKLKCEFIPTYCKFESRDEPQTETEIVKAIVHKIIDDAIIAEDAYPDLRQEMHDAVDEYEPQTERSE